MRKSGSNAVNEAFTKFSKPFNTDSTHNNAIVPTATPHIDTNVMMLMALCVFFENR